ncbi:MAG TPA: 3-ketoacyl-ACP reductase [Gemmataceae bacterium]|nr:3-ketoacyl-ACP reductase [Gemmataceae bacterium]
MPVSPPFLDKPVALVTGGSRGIGRGICVELAKAGYAIAINYASQADAAQATASLLGSATPTLLLQADIGVAAEREQMIDKVMAEWGRIDLLVNNAAITSVGRKDILEATEESWEHVLAVNLKGPFFLCQRVANEMIRLRPRLAAPAIVNIGSVSAYTVSTNRGDYCISKAGLRMVTQLFAARLAEFDILVYEVCPGVIETDMTAAKKSDYDRLIAEGLTPQRRWGSPADVGKAVAALASGQFAFSTGAVVPVDGGFHIRRL